MKKIILLLVLTLSGCAMHFTHPTKSTADYKKDWNGCRVKLNQAGMAQGYGQKQFMQECMEGEGWTRED